MKPARRRTAFALAIVLSGMAACAGPARADCDPPEWVTIDPPAFPEHPLNREFKMWAIAILEDAICGPTAIRRGPCPPPDEWGAILDERVEAERAAERRAAER